jgi:pimeloyl-ACP methyl ester carboxylesterase
MHRIMRRLTRVEAGDMLPAAMASFRHQGQRLAYRSFGSGSRAVILLPGILLPVRMHEPLARALADRGNRVILLDLLGHGRSDRPRDMWRYSMSSFGEEVVALMDHLELDEAVVGGTSLGANTTLEVASIAPERVRGMILEMPVLDNALLACAVFFTPLMVGLTFGEPVYKVFAAALQRIPRGALPFYAGIGLDWLGQDPGPSAAMIQGVFFGRVAPHRSVRKTFTAPALVIGHHRDPIHPFSDAGMLADELPNGRLLEAESLVELRMAPERLTTEIADFVDAAWKPRRAKGGRRRRAAAS